MEMFMNRKIRLIALDLDGTLFNSNGQISEKNRAALRCAAAGQTVVVISTGRPYIGLPLAEMKEIGIDYAITANGAGVYRITDRKCLLEDVISPGEGAALLRELYRYPVHIDAFIGGGAYTQSSTRGMINRLQVSESLRAYIRDTRTVVDDLAGFIWDHQLGIQKLTINFIPDAGGALAARDDVANLLSGYPAFHFVSGGFSNIEVNKSGVSKAKGLRFLCEALQIPLAQTMACGDSENDLAILTAAGLGVAMANAEPKLLKAADFVTRSNNEDGVAYALWRAGLFRDSLACGQDENLT